MDYCLHIAILACIFAILAVSYNLIMGYARLFSLCHAAMFGVGAYASALFSTGLQAGIFPSLVVAAAVSAAMGALIGFPALRVKSYYLAVLSIGFQQVATGLMVNLVGVTGGESGMGDIPRPVVFGLPIATKPAYLAFVAVMAVLSFVAALRITASPFGRVIKAIREDEEAVRALGKNVVYFKVSVFVFSGAMAGVAGSLYAHYVTFINPTSFTFLESVFIISMVVVGGTANLWGSLLGATILVTVPELTRFIHGFSEGVVGPARLILYGAMLIVMVRFRPKGLLPEYFRLGRSRPDPGVAPAFEGSTERSGVLLPLKAEGPARRPAGSDPGEVLLEARGLNKSFGGLRAVQDLSIDLQKGRITSLIGPNGAGKTTFFNLVTGAIAPDSGEVRYRGRNLTGLRPHQTTRCGFSRTFQELRLFPQMTVLDTVLVARPRQSGENLLRAFGPLSREAGENRAESLRILDFVGLLGRRDELVENLSYAEQKLLSLARLLATDTELLLLDEPTSGLDPRSIGTILGLVKSLPQLGKTVCLVEHNLDVIREVSDRVNFLAEGRVVKAGDPDEIFSDSKLAEIYFGGGAAFELGTGQR